MAALAQGLEVVPIEDQRGVAPVALDMVHNLRFGAAEGTGWMQVQELGPQCFPLARVAALAAVRALGIMALPSGAYAVTLAGAEGASGHDSTAGTEAGWCRHQRD